MAKIVLINRHYAPDASGSSRVATDLAEFLAQDGRTVNVLTGRYPHTDKQQPFPANEVRHGVSIDRVWSTQWGRGSERWLVIDYLTFHLMVFFTLPRLLRHGDTCVVLTDPPLLMVTVWVIARLRGARLICWVHDFFPEVAVALYQSRAVRFLAAPMRWLRNLAFRDAVCNVVLGKRMQAQLESTGVPSSRIRLIQNWGGDPLQDCSPDDITRLREQWGLQGQFVAAYTGNIGPAHELDDLLSAAQLLKDDPAYSFLIVGDGLRRAQLEQRLCDRGARNVHLRTHLDGPLRQHALALPDVHIVTLNPLLEGYVVPSKFYWGAATGRPTIFIGDCDGEIAELLHEHGCGLAVQSGDVNGLVEALQRLRTKPELANDMGKNARNLIQTKLGRTHSLQAWRALLMELDGGFPPT